MSRPRHSGAALAAPLALAAGCGGADDAGLGGGAAVTAETVSEQAGGGCQPAGGHGGATYRVCYTSPADRGLEVTRGGDAERIRVSDPPGSTIGHWRWAALSPDGKTFVATWSAECEVPFAFTFAAAGGAPEPATGEAGWQQASASEALGWTTSGDPLVRLAEADCGRSAEAPGTYVVEDGKLRKLAEELEPSPDPRDVE